MPERSQHPLPITLCVNTYNEAANLRPCLASCAGLVSEVLVADMGSDDGTVEVARRLGASVLALPQAGYAEPGRQALIDRAGQPWILLLDADETLSPGLRHAIPSLIGDPEVAAVLLPRRNTIFGRVMRYSGFWPDYQLRLFRKGLVTWPTRVHAMPEVRGKIMHAPADPSAAIWHASHRDISGFIEKANRYTDFDVADRSPHLTKTELILLALGPFYEFVNRFIFKQAFRDGRQGIQVGLLMVFYRLAVALKAWEARNPRVTPAGGSQPQHDGQQTGGHIADAGSRPTMTSAATAHSASRPHDS